MSAANNPKRPLPVAPGVALESAWGRPEGPAQPWTPAEVVGAPVVGAPVVGDTGEPTALAPEKVRDMRETTARDPQSVKDTVTEAERLQREHSQKRERKRQELEANVAHDGRAETRPPELRPPERPLVDVRAPDRQRSEQFPRPQRSSPPTAPPLAAQAALGAPRRTPAPQPLSPQVPERRPDPPPDSPSLTVVDAVAVEVEEVIRDARTAWRRWPLADRITFLAAIATVAGTLLPWLSDHARPLQLGITSGGVFHAAFAAWAIALLVKRDRMIEDRSLKASQRRASARRTSLLHLMLGAASTFLGTYYLVFFGMLKADVPDLQIRFGLYVTLAAGMGLSYGGFSRFLNGHE